MTARTLGVVMNGVTGRMGTRRHLLRSVLAINEQGGVTLSGGERVLLRPVLVGRDAAKLRDLAERHGIADWTTSREEAINDPGTDVYFDAQVTSARVEAVTEAIESGRHVYVEKPTAENHADAARLARRAKAAGVKNGVVQDKLFLPGLLKLRRLIDGGFFGRILSVRGEFGYWVFEGDWQHPQRPSWNYRAEDGGGVVLDMFPHWAYVLESLFGRIEAVTARAVTHIPTRTDEDGEPYAATADDAAYGIFELEGGVIAQIIACASTATSRWSSGSTARTAARSPACANAASSTVGRRRDRYGTPMSPRRRTTVVNGRTSRTTRISPMVSRLNGRCSCGTSSRTRRSPTTSPPERGACRPPRRACVLPPKAGESNSRWLHDHA